VENSATCGISGGTPLLLSVMVGFMGCLDEPAYILFDIVIAVSRDFIHSRGRMSRSAREARPSVFNLLSPVPDSVSSINHQPTRTSLCYQQRHGVGCLLETQSISERAQPQSTTTSLLLRLPCLRRGSKTCEIGILKRLVIERENLATGFPYGGWSFGLNR
jgi:hypothetical protein